MEINYNENGTSYIIVNEDNFKELIDENLREELENYFINNKRFNILNELLKNNN